MNVSIKGRRIPPFFCNKGGFGGTLPDCFEQGGGEPSEVFCKPLGIVYHLNEIVYHQYGMIYHLEEMIYNQYGMIYHLNEIVYQQEKEGK